jgi:hypothetical protein
VEPLGCRGDDVTKRELLSEAIVIRQRMLDRCIAAQTEAYGSVSDDDIDEARLRLLEAQLRLMEEPGDEKK